MATRSFWGWGHRERALDEEQRSRLKMLLATQLDASCLSTLEPPALADVVLPRARIRLPDALSSLMSQTDAARAGHTYGKAFRDLVRGLQGDFAVAPDLVAYPKDEADIVRVLDWCAEQRVAVIPYGGGSSVVGGVEARIEGSDLRGAVSLDLSALAGVDEVDTTSRAALIRAGTYGPEIEDALKPHGLSLRHYPQSFEFSTLGGWLATRAGGHFATLYTHIDDLCQAMRVVTPSGVLETRRLPASGAGPSPDRLFLGSEGALGIIVNAWMRLQPRPVYRASSSLGFKDFYAGAQAVRALAQSGLYPANCRLLDPLEALINGVGDGETTFVLVAFESGDHDVAPWMARALEIARAHGGEVSSNALKTPLALPDTGQGDAAARWKKMFLRAPYMRDALVRIGALVETFETAITWDAFEDFHRALLEAGQRALREVCGKGTISCRFTHAYPDGVAPYYTVIGAAKPRSQVAQWDAIKAAVSEAIISHGGTITHHHAVGRDHRPWYDRQRPALFGEALAGAKERLDPTGILNPGVLIG